VFDGATMQTVAADGQRTSFEPTTGSFDRFIFIEEYSLVVGWICGETELHVSNNQHGGSAVELLLAAVCH